MLECDLRMTVRIAIGMRDGRELATCDWIALWCWQCNLPAYALHFGTNGGDVHAVSASFDLRYD